MIKRISKYCVQKLGHETGHQLHKERTKQRSLLANGKRMHTHNMPTLIYGFSSKSNWLQ